MTDIAAPAVSPNLLASPAQPTAAELAKRANIQKAAQSFEASFLSVMLGQMFQGVQPDAPFGGGPGEAMFKSFMTDAMAKKMTDRGGIGIADKVGREMLKLQGLT